MDGVLRRYAEVVAAVRLADESVRIVGVDGCGGAGKTTFADRLSRAAGGCPVVHTDDFASHDEPIEWWPRLLAHVIEPLSRGEPGRFHAYDWTARERRAEATVVPPGEIVVVEGVGATRAAWRDRLAISIWVEAPRDLRLRRGVERDGEELRDFWVQWMADEDRYVAAEDPASHADVVVDGAPSVPHNAEADFVVLQCGPPRGWAGPRVIRP